MELGQRENNVKKYNSLASIRIEKYNTEGVQGSFNGVYSNVEVFFC